MKLLILFSVLFITINALPFENPNTFNGTQWVVLVAGSNGYYNYRHQADVYHAYQVIHGHGIPDENIIVFHYDDIANDPENPTPGVVINKPGGSDVYHGVPKDYVGADVTPANFLAALQGSKELAAQGKKVVNSGPNDHIFIYFTDHGAPDLIAFPSEYLYGEDLNKVLKALHDNKRYAQLVFYLEACESGSMFATLLPTNINIYATTAANPTESSYACYWDDQRQTYLGDVYSVNWIENSDKRTLGNETLDQQFAVVKQETNTSHVEEYGEASLGSLPLTQFQGPKPYSLSSIFIGTPIHINHPFDAVDSGNVPVMRAYKRIGLAQTEEEKRERQYEYESLMKGRNFLYEHMIQFASKVRQLLDVSTSDALFNQKRDVSHRTCYRTLVDTFHERCLNLNKHSYALRLLYVLNNICELEFESEVVNSSEFIPKIQTLLINHCDEHYISSYPNSII